ncbi:hypothetical protein AGMMS49949_04530 [Alphaproteobacteria bacterium]|nr:hypothetical protein AGMMS49949_04530 [Alphaproteobacteria bacterium]GHS97665.1 hypothetical protein AGMMS50296_4840 [Alphaproteobacteria bacterium]
MAYENASRNLAISAEVTENSARATAILNECYGNLSEFLGARLQKVENILERIWGGATYQNLCKKKDISPLELVLCFDWLIEKEITEIGRNSSTGEPLTALLALSCAIWEDSRDEV